MTSFQDVLDAAARVVGGTNVGANQPRFFSGDQVGDSSGIQVAYGPTLKGCYSEPPDAFTDFPVGVVLTGNFEVRSAQGNDVYIQGEEINIDDLRLDILFARQDSETTYTNLAQYRDLVPAAFAAHMGLFATANVLQAMVRGGRPVTFVWGGIPYSAYEFTVRVIRIISRVYAA